MTRPGQLKKGCILPRLSFLSRRLFSETKVDQEQCSQASTPTQFQPQNGLQRPQEEIRVYFGTRDHVIDKCGSKSPLNGCAGKQQLENQESNVKIKADLTQVQWKQALTHNSTPMNGGWRKCSFVARRDPPEPHLVLPKCFQDVSTRFKGHANCGKPVLSAKIKQSASMPLEKHALGLMDANDSHNSTFDEDSGQPCCFNAKETSKDDLDRGGLVHETMQTIKDVSKPDTNHLETQRRDSGGDGSGGFSSQKEIRDQIQRVVMNLEEVLHGLKEIHLEMKQVVQEIDLLTADIGLDKDELEDTLRRSHSRIIDFNVMPLLSQNLQSSELKSHPPSGFPPEYPMGNPVVHQALKSTQGFGGVSKKPPPYHYAVITGRGKVKAKTKKTPPYPFRRRLLSTIV
ncbi:hypothetical protein DNTS_027482 [Danionella cerebrum]|uniref:Uncharacterized protein n=1 Tax=Danionella cerebrum TaxID=2873325 RepID=A0A553RMC5_9TELE|nr:hypothetical protein DNTS_027482 [Danionella translucida]